MLETADDFWAAQKVTSGFRNISNALSIESTFDLSSEGLQEKAQAGGFWDGSGEFSFTKAFSDGGACPRYAAGRKLLEANASGEGTLNSIHPFSSLQPAMQCTIIRWLGSFPLCSPLQKCAVADFAQVLALLQFVSLFVRGHIHSSLQFHCTILSPLQRPSALEFQASAVPP